MIAVAIARVGWLLHDLLSSTILVLSSLLAHIFIAVFVVLYTLAYGFIGESKEIIIKWG